MLRTIPGMRDREIIREGYAIEYDCIDPHSLDNALGSRDVAGLFFAGQMNGSSGYEEAAAQGLYAGINCSALLKGGGAAHTFPRRRLYRCMVRRPYRKGHQRAIQDDDLPGGVQAAVKAGQRGRAADGAWQADGAYIGRTLRAAYEKTAGDSERANKA